MNEIYSLELDYIPKILESSIITYELYHCHGRCYEQRTNEHYAVKLHFAMESVDEYI